MIKTIQKVIGQSEAKSLLNEIIEAKNFADKKNKSFNFPNLHFTGPSGVGKSHFAEQYADRFLEAGFQYIEIPVNAGWRFYADLAGKACSIDDDSGMGTAIPTIFFVDEAHEPSPIEEQLKLITGTKHAKLFERNGTKFYHDPAQHQWIFASNEDLDEAQARRLTEVPFGIYDRSEKKALFKVMCQKDLDDQVIDYFEGRTKPMAGHIEKVCKRLNLQPVDRIKIDLAKSLVQHMGLFPMGLEKKDLQLMLRMAKGSRPTPIDALRATIGDVKTSSTRKRLGWLQALEVTEIRRGGYGLTTSGINYLKNLADLQSTKKAKKK